MIIDVTSNVRIRYEAMNYIIEKKTVVGEAITKKKGAKPKAENIGTVRWDTLGYHSNMKSAAQSLLTRHMHALLEDASATRSLNVLIEAIDAGAALIAEAVAQQQPLREPVTEEAKEEA